MANARLVPVTMEQLQAARLQALHGKISGVRQSLKTPTFPIYPGAPDDSVETQIAFFNDVPKYYRNGAWRSFVSVPEFAIYSAGAGSGLETAASGAEQFFTFGTAGQLLAGTEMFDYSIAADQPTPLRDGVYAFSVSATWTSAAVTGPGRPKLTFELTGLDSNYTTSGFVQAKANFDMVDLYAPQPGGDTGAGSVAGTWPAWTTTVFRLGLLNNDTALSQSVYNYQCVVIRHGDLPT